MYSVASDTFSPRCCINELRYKIFSKAHFHMGFNKEIAGKARTAKDDISISSMIRPVKSQEHQAVFLHQKIALMAFIYALACYYAASVLCNSSRKETRQS